MLSIHFLNDRNFRSDVRPLKSAISFKLFAEEFSLNWLSFLTQYQKKHTSLQSVGKTCTVLMTQIANFITLCQRS